MRVMLKIARLELSTLFFSPVAWLILIVFTIQCGVTFTDLLKMYQQYLQMGNTVSSLTDYLFYWPGYPLGFFPEVQSYLYLYIPLLTMGLLSREYSSGSIKLLYSSPVTVAQIVGGKFLAMMGYGLAMMAVLGLYVIIGAVSISALEIGMVLTGLFGLYLLICAYSAMGLFMSSLTPYQVAAAISTLVVLAALRYVGQIGQDIDFVRDLTDFLSIDRRADLFVAGMISSKDLLYFLLVMGMFLGFTWLKMQSEREFRPLAVRAGQYAGLVVAVLLVGYASSRPTVTGYIDNTSNERRTLSESSQAAVQNIQEKPLNLTYYVNILDENFNYGLQSMRNEDMRLFETYLRFKPDINFEYVYYWAPSKNKRLYDNNPGASDEDLARMMAEAWELNFEDLLTLQEIDRIIDLKPEEYRFVRQFEYDGRTTFVRMFQDQRTQPGEEEISAAIKRLVDGPVKVGFAGGHGERQIARADDRHYNQAITVLPFRYSLINHGFEPLQFSLAARDIPEDLDILVIADPMRAYSDYERSKIAAFVSSGGHLILAGEAGREAIANPLAEPFGLVLNGNKLLKKSEKFAEDFILASLTDEAVRRAGDSSGIYREESSMLGRAVKLYKGGKISMPGVTEIEFKPAAAAGEFTTYRLLKADSTVTAVALTREVAGAIQRIVVLGDADFMSNSELLRANENVANIAFVLDTFQWLSGGNYPIVVNRPETHDTEFKMNAGSISAFRVLVFGIVPGLMLLAGGVLLVRRRRR